MPFVHITWLPKTCRNAKIRQQVADAVIKAMVSVEGADISANNLVVRFSESVDGFRLPIGHSQNPNLQGIVNPEAEAFLASSSVSSTTNATTTNSTTTTTPK